MVATISGSQGYRDGGGYIDVEDVDGGDDPAVVVVTNVIRGTDRPGNDFVDERSGSISAFFFANSLNLPPFLLLSATVPMP